MRVQADQDGSRRGTGGRAPAEGTVDRRWSGAGTSPIRWVVVLGACMMALAATACDDGITIPKRQPFMDGELQGVNDVDFTLVDFAPGFGWEAPDVIESLLVREDEGDPCGVTWTVDGSTDLLVREGSALRRATPDDLVPFGRVRVWAVGDVVAESCPGQGLAETVELR